MPETVLETVTLVVVDREEHDDADEEGDDCAEGVDTDECVVSVVEEAEMELVWHDVVVTLVVGVLLREVVPVVDNVDVTVEDEVRVDEWEPLTVAVFVDDVHTVTVLVPESVGEMEEEAVAVRLTVGDALEEGEADPERVTLADAV